MFDLVCFTESKETLKILIFHISCPVCGTEPKLLTYHQVMVVITNNKLNALQKYSLTFILACSSSNSLIDYTRMVLSIENLLITFCQHGLKMI